MPTALEAQTGTILILLATVFVAVACGVLIAVVIVLAVRRPRTASGPGAAPDAGVRREIAEINRRLVTLEKGMAQIVDHLPSAVQGVGVIRYNPFPEMGGNMSFSLALLDGRANGVVVSVLNNREGSRAYAKPVEAGHSSHTLSGEEQRALALARGRRPEA